MRTTLAVIGIAAMLLGAGAAAAAELETAAADTSGLAALLAAHAAALGDQSALAAGAGFEMSGDMEAAGKHGRFRFLVTGFGFHRLDIDLGPLSEASGFDGRTAWIHDANGVTRRLHLAEQDEAILRGVFFAGAYLTSERPLIADSLRLSVRRLAPGKEKIELALHPGRGLEIDLAEDTHLAVATVWRDGGVEIRTEFGDYRPVAGVQIPHRVDRDLPGGLEEHYRVTTARALASPPPDSVLSAPPSRRNVTFPARGDAVIPLKSVGQHIFVAARINDRDAGLFFLDTGAGANCVNERVAKELGLPAVGDVAATGVGGIANTEYRRAGSLAVGDVRMGEHIIVALDLEPIEKVMGLRIGGIVGYDFLSQVVFTLDYEAGTLTVRDPAAFAPPPGMARTGIVIGKNTPLLPGTVEDRAGGWFRVDSGAGDLLSLHGPFVRAHDLLAGRATKEATAMGVGGQQRLFTAELASLTIAGERFAPAAASFTLAEEGALADEDIAGTIGGQFLRQVVTTFDYGRERAYLLRRPPRPERGFGFGARLDGEQLVVTEVKPDRPAARAGLRAGDRILTLRGAPVGRAQMLDLAALFRFAPGEDEVELAVDRAGERVTLALHPVVASAP